MSKAAPPQRWFTGWRSPAPPPVLDAADLGTAFGLDMSLLPAPADTAGPQPKPAPRRGWMQRLASRGKPAA
jgi:hypothetical protein